LTEPNKRETWDVAIVGAGPVGVVLAGLLGKRSVRVIAIERESTIVDVPRAGHFDHTVLRSLQELGCLDEVLSESIPNRGLDMVNGKGALLAHLRGDIQASSGLPASIHFHQPTLEAIVRREVASMATVELALGVEMKDFTNSDDGVLIRTDAIGRLSEVSASYLVGCDGAASTVRKLAGIELEDLGFDETWLVVDLLVGDSDLGLPRNTVALCDPERPGYSIEMDSQRHRLEFMVMPGEDADEMQRAESLDSLISQWVDPALVHIERAAVYQFHALLAREWSKGRAIIAGDAAHQMPPFLGQGLCTGIRDAENLAWKLARVISGGAGDTLLDTYELERKPRARELIESAVEFGELICEIDPEVAAERHESMLSDERPPERRMMFRLGRLDEGPLVFPGGGSFFPQPTVNGTRLDDLIGLRFFVLARSDDALSDDRAWWEETVEAKLMTLDELPADAARPLAGWMDARNTDVVMVRPDRYVLGVGPSLPGLKSRVMESPILAGGP
jgi:3-(3-hydroxy-phenyl)propionate hydroxylase